MSYNGATLLIIIANIFHFDNCLCYSKKPKLFLLTFCTLFMHVKLKYIERFKTFLYSEDEHESFFLSMTMKENIKFRMEENY